MIYLAAEIKDNDDAICTLVVSICDGPVSLLACGVPLVSINIEKWSYDLKFDGALIDLQSSESLYSSTINFMNS